MVALRVVMVVPAVALAVAGDRLGRFGQRAARLGNAGGGRTNHDDRSDRQRRREDTAPDGNLT